MGVIDVESIPWVEAVNPREGTVDTKVLVDGELGGGVKFLWRLVKYRGGDDAFGTPRHRHTWGQVRFCVEGSLNYGPRKEIPEAWACYFPPGAFYGPQEQTPATVLLLQYGRTYALESEKREALKRLADRGRLHDGIYTYTDPETGKVTNRDAVEALEEEIHGRAVAYRTPLYQEPILINPEAATWTEVDEGVTEGRLGNFPDSEVNLTLTMARWKRGASVVLKPEELQLGYLLSGRVSTSDQELRAPSVFKLGGAEDLAIDVLDDAEALFMEMGAGGR